jgi:hypothetical protein
MKYDYMFLCLVIPGPEHPGTRLHVMMQPLIDDLDKLWQGVEAYDCYKKQRFTLRASSGRSGLPEISGRLIWVIINSSFENCYPKLYPVF